MKHKDIYEKLVAIQRDCEGVLSDIDDLLFEMDYERPNAEPHKEWAFSGTFSTDTEDARFVYTEKTKEDGEKISESLANVDATIKRRSLWSGACEPFNSFYGNIS